MFSSNFLSLLLSVLVPSLFILSTYTGTWRGIAPPPIPWGTRTIICLSRQRPLALHSLMSGISPCTFAPPLPVSSNQTLPGRLLKLAPKIVMVWPSGPLFGSNKSTRGSAVDDLTVKLTGLLFCPALFCICAPTVAGKILGTSASTLAFAHDLVTPGLPPKSACAWPVFVLNLSPLKVTVVPKCPDVGSTLQSPG